MNYEYEPSVEQYMSGQSRHKCTPTFSYPDAQLLHEHFYLDEYGEAPTLGLSYLEKVHLHRMTHLMSGMSFVETTSASLRTGGWMNVVDAALRAHGITPTLNESRLSHAEPLISRGQLLRYFRPFQQHAHCG